VRESLGDFQRALELVRPLQGTESSPLDTLATLRDIYAGRAHAYLALRQYAEALRDWDEAIACDWDCSPVLRAYRAICLARLRDIERAAAEADRLYQEHPKTGSLLYNLACVHAVIAEVLAQDQQKPPEQNPQREAHALQALDLLRQAADLGYFRTPHRLDYLQRDPDLDVLRNREDFKRLLEKLTATP
jgi:tetratricopeptide (TPR) repeat protein